MTAADVLTRMHETHRARETRLLAELLRPHGYCHFCRAYVVAPHHHSEKGQP